MTVFVSLFPLLQNVALVLVVLSILSSFVASLSFVRSRGFQTLSLAVYVAVALLSALIGFWLGALIWGLNALITFIHR